jgi:hypothetical protein
MKALLSSRTNLRRNDRFAPRTGPSAIGAFDPLRKFRRCRVRSLRSAPASLTETAELERSELVQNSSAQQRRFAMPVTEMKHHVYKILELIGSSEKRIEDAVSKCHHSRIKDHSRNAAGHRFATPLPKSNSCKSSHINARICAAGASLGQKHRLRLDVLWHALDVAYEGYPDLSQDR